jgi:flagellin-like hook-associated protein FlgL
MKHAVFISHAHQDKSIAETICAKLESADLSCWIATRDISAHEDWTEDTRKAIGSSRVIVLLLSENTNAAVHIERELAHAYYMRRTILPLRLTETLPRREILFYLGDVPWLSASNPPTEEQLEELTSRVKGLIPDSTAAGKTVPLQSVEVKAATFTPAYSWYGALEASHYQTLGILKWVAISVFLCAVVLFSWFVLRQTKEWASLAESRGHSVDRGFSLAPTPLPQGAANALESKQTSPFTHFASPQAANGSPTPLVQGAQDSPLTMPAEQLVDATSSPTDGVNPGDGSGESASEARPHRLPPVTNRISHQVSHDRHPQFPGTQVKEARRIAQLEDQRDSLKSELKDTEANVAAIQKNADLLTNQRDELQTRLKESEEKTRIAQKNGELLASELDELGTRLKETESRALTAEKGEEIALTQRDALQTRLEETEDEAHKAQKNTDLATRQVEALQSELGEVRERAQRAETNASLAASQRDAMESELKKKEEEQAQERKAQQNQNSAGLAEVPYNAPDTQFQEVRQVAPPVHEDAELAQTQPPNPGQNAEPAPLTQALDSFLQPTAPSGK